jgi:hypothetical protein
MTPDKVTSIEEGTLTRVPNGVHQKPHKDVPSQVNGVQLASVTITVADERLSAGGSSELSASENESVMAFWILAGVTVASKYAK